jgi:hypothetical protein
LKPSYVTEFTGTLDVGFSKDYSFRVNVQRKFDHNTYKTINLNVPISAYTRVNCATDPGPDGIVGTSDDVANGACFYTVPTSDARLNAPANTYYAPNDEAHHEGDNAYTAYVFTFNGKYANRLNFVGAYGVDMSHTNPLNPFTTVNGAVYGTYAPGSTSSSGGCATPTGITNPSGTSVKCEGPNAFFFDAAVAGAPTVWSQSLKMSGIFGLPDLLPFVPKFHLGGVQYAAQFVSQNGAYFQRVINVTDANGTAQTVVMQNHQARYPWLSNWDNEIRKKFKLGEGRQTLEFTWDLFNTMNANTITAYRSSNVSSSLYLQPDHKTPLQPGTVLAPRIQEWGLTYRF